MTVLVADSPSVLTSGVSASERAGEWAEAIALWLLTLQAAGEAKSSRGLRGYQLRRFAAWSTTGPWEVTGDDLLEWIGQHEWQPATLHSYRAALRLFFGWAAETGRIERSPARVLPKVKLRPPRPRPAPEDAYREALACPDERVRVMVRLAAELGLRRGEVAASHSDWLVRDLTGWTLRVTGKGGKVRDLPLTASLAAALRARGPGYLFPGNVDGHLSAAWVGRLVSREMPGVWAMHSLRHRFLTVAFSYEKDITVVQELAGHASIVTTRGYIFVRPEALRRTVEAVARI